MYIIDYKFACNLLQASIVKAFILIFRLPVHIFTISTKKLWTPTFNRIIYSITSPTINLEPLKLPFNI